MIAYKKYLTVIGIFMLGLIVGTIDFTRAEVIQNEDDISPYFLFYDRILPQTMINVLESYPGVIEVILNHDDKTSMIRYNPEQFTLTKSQMIRYLEGIEAKFVQLEIDQIFFNGYEIPSDCDVDALNHSRVYSKYMVNGVAHYLEDGRCEEIKRSYREE